MNAVPLEQMSIGQEPQRRRGWHSFAEILRFYLNNLVDENQLYLEWGPGYSTWIALNYLPKKRIFSVEHNLYWAVKAKELFGYDINICHTKLNSQTYVNPYPGKQFSFLFVDGERHNRVRCLNSILENNMLADNGFVILHDAQRPEYKEGIDLYRQVDSDMREDTLTVVLKKENF